MAWMLVMVLLATSDGGTRPASTPFEEISAAERSGDDVRALKLADTLVRKMPAWPLARLEAARLRLKLGQELERAELDLEVARAISPELPRAHFLWGLLREERKDDVGAVNAYEAAVRLRPSYDEARLRLAGIRFAKGEWAQAAEHYAQVVAAHPDWTHVRLQWVGALEKAGRVDEAEAELLRLRQQDPGSRIAARRLAELYERSGRPTEAAKVRAELEAQAEPKKKMRPLKKSRR